MGNKHDYDIRSRKEKIAKSVQLFIKEKKSIEEIADILKISESLVKKYLTSKETLYEVYGSIDGNKIYDFCQKKFEISKRMKKAANSQEPEQKRKGR